MGSAQYTRDDDERGGYGGDYGRWQEGQSYGRGYGKDRSEQFASDYGPRGRFRGQGYDQSGGDNWYGGESARGGGGMSDLRGGGNFGGGRGGQNYYASQTESGGSYPRSYNEMYGQGSRGDRGFGEQGGFGGGPNFGGQSYGGQNYGTGSVGQTYGRGFGGERGPQGWGEHRGKGPKNYSRSDDRIREEVCDRLTDDAHLDASEIDIEVKNGEVTLTGSVSGRDAKRRAEDTIENCSGVKHVQNNLRVKGQSSQGQSGQDGQSTGETSSGSTRSSSSSKGSTQQNLGSPKTA
jgi:hypothetical protein